MKILVTGATGFLGYHIASKLKEEGHEVYNFSRSHTDELDQLNIPTIKGDLCNQDSLNNALTGVEAVFHVAGKVGMWGKWDDFYQANVQGTKNLVRAMKEKGIKYLVYTSTPSVVFGKEPIINGDESLPYPEQYLSIYAKSKAIAEHYVLKSCNENFFATSIRPHLIYGPRDKNIIPRLIKAHRENRLKAIGNRDNIVDIIYVENAASAHIKALNELVGNKRNNAKAYFIGQEAPVNLWEFIDDILESKSLTKVSKTISLKKAYIIGYIIEVFLRTFRIFNVHPPMTRFVALQLGTSHYFSHENARKDFGYRVITSTAESLEKLK